MTAEGQLEQVCVSTRDLPWLVCCRTQGELLGCARKKGHRAWPSPWPGASGCRVKWTRQKSAPGGAKPEGGECPWSLRRPRGLTIDVLLWHTLPQPVTAGEPTDFSSSTCQHRSRPPLRL